MTDGLDGFNDDAWDASDDYASSLDAAGGDYGRATLALERAYSRRIFAAEKLRTENAFAAWRDESEGNAEVDKLGAKQIADASSEMSEAAKIAVNNFHDTVMATGYLEAVSVWTQGKGIVNTALNNIKAYPNARSVASQSAATLISTTKSANKTARENAVTAAEKAYDLSEAVATATYATGSLVAWTDYLTTALAAGASYDEAVKAAGDAYTNTENTAWKDYVNRAAALENAFDYAINAIAGNQAFDGAEYIRQVGDGQHAGNTVQSSSDDPVDSQPNPLFLSAHERFKIDLRNFMKEIYDDYNQSWKEAFPENSYYWKFIDERVVSQRHNSYILKEQRYSVHKIIIPSSKYFFKMPMYSRFSQSVSLFFVEEKNQDTSPVPETTYPFFPGATRSMWDYKPLWGGKFSPQIKESSILDPTYQLSDDLIDSLYWDWSPEKGRDLIGKFFTLDQLKGYARDGIDSGLRLLFPSLSPGPDHGIQEGWEPSGLEIPLGKGVRSNVGTDEISISITEETLIWIFRLFGR